MCVKRRKIALSAFAWLMLCAAGCQEKPKPPAPSVEATAPASQPTTSSRHQGPGRVYDPANGFSVVPPADFTSKVPSVGGFMTLIGPRDYGVSATVVAAARADKGISPEQAVQAVKNDLKSIHRNYSLMGEGQVAIDGRQASFVVSRYTQGAANMESICYCIPGTKGKFFVVTMASHARAFTEHRKEFAAAAGSIMAD